MFIVIRSLTRRQQTPGDQKADHFLAADLVAVFFAPEADLDLVSFASPFPLPALFDGVDLPLLPALADDLLADELPPEADFVPPPEALLAEVFFAPADEVPLLPLVDEPRLAVDDDADADFLLPPAELLLLVEPLELFDEPADLVVLLADPLLVPAEDEAVLPLPLLFEPPLLFVPPEADFLLPPPELERLPADFLPAELLPLELFAVLRPEPLREPEPLFEPFDVELFVPNTAEADCPPTAFFIAVVEAPTTAPVAAPATMSPISSVALLPTRSFALS